MTMWYQFAFLILLHSVPNSVNVNGLSFIPIPEYFMENGFFGHCGDTITDQNAYVRSQIGANYLGQLINYKNSQDCKIYINGSIGNKISIQFLDIDLQRTPGGACVDVLHLFDGPSGDNETTAVMSVCENSGASFTSSDNTAVLRFVSDGSITAPGFSLLVTEFNDSPCNDDFQCDTNRCIVDDLKCNGVYNCLDKTDETKENAGCTLLDTIVGSIRGLGQYAVLALIILICSVTVLVFCSIMLYPFIVKGHKTRRVKVKARA